jgi:hypothetical protein
MVCSHLVQGPGGRSIGRGVLGNTNGSVSRRVDETEVDKTEVVESEPLGEELDIVVAQIKRIARTAGLEFALRVGAVIVHHFYDGDVDSWRSRGPKVASFRRLASHPALPLSAGSLYRCVAIFELCERLNAPARWGHLGASHLRLVLGLSPAAQERILALANSKRWSVKKLQQELSRENPSRLTCGGRRAEPEIAKSLRSVRRCLDVHRDLIERADRVSSRDLQQSMHLIEETKRCLERLSLSLAGGTSIEPNATQACRSTSLLGEPAASPKSRAGFLPM